MTIKTLTYIHDLLKEEADKREKAYKWMRDIANAAEEQDQPNKDELKKQVEIARHKRFEAENALADFESKEW